MTGTSTPDREPRGVLWALVGLALAVRVILVMVTPLEIAWPDGREFDAIARLLVDHGTYGTQTLRPPGYPTLIAAVYRLFGSNLLTLRLVESLLGAATVWIIGRVGTRLFDSRAGLAAAAIAAFHPVMAFLPATQFSENTLLFVLALAFLAMTVAWRRSGIARWLLAGALFGVAMLVRPNVLVLMPGLAFGLALALHRERRGWIPAILGLTLGAVLTVTPWIVREHAVHGHWYFVATGGGRQFWFGNNETTSGASDAPTEADARLRKELQALPDDTARERHLYGRGIKFVKEHPMRAARLYFVKLGNLFALYPRTYSRTAFVNPASQAAQAIASAFVFAGALLALRRLRSTPALWPLVGAIVTFALVNAVFLTVMRYRLAFEPCLIWMAGFGWAGALARFRSAETQPMKKSTVYT
jgi:4-amino-4-deoxy-L-arabinose transferase-like glycosyltransferase